jgi:hypothetical protein
VLTTRSRWEPQAQPQLRDGDLVLMAATTIAVASLYDCQPLLPIFINVLRNDKYCILNSFAALEDTPGIPGLDTSGLDIVSNILGSSMCFKFSAH